MDGTNPIEGKAPIGQQGPATTPPEPLVPAAGFPCHASSGDQSFTELLGWTELKVLSHLPIFLDTIFTFVTSAYNWPTETLRKIHWR